MLPLLAPILGFLGSLGKSWLDTRKAKVVGKLRITEAKIEAKVTKIKAEGNMDIQSVNDMRYSWKDEFWSLIFGAILIGCFLPWTQPYIQTGFVFMKDSTPEWFEWGLLGIIAASFGLRTFMGWKK